jgi:DNA-binding transcriptional ArsR family regulator
VVDRAAERDGQQDLVFRALSDIGRRRLLDELFVRDGQSVNELCAVLPAMTRFGVMKHLGVLADAGLVTTRREGRSKLHFLNPMPIREIHDRWISKFAEPWVCAMNDLKQQLEHDPSLEDESCPQPGTSTRPTSDPPPNESGRDSPIRRSRNAGTSAR